MASSFFHTSSSPASHGLNRCMMLLLLGTVSILAAPVTEPVENLHVTRLPSTRANTDVDRVGFRSLKRNLDETPTTLSANDDESNASFVCETPSATLSQSTAESIGSGESLAKRFLSPSQEGSSMALFFLSPHERTTRDDDSTLVGHPLLPAFYLASSFLFALGLFVLLYRRKAPAPHNVRLNVSVTGPWMRQTLSSSTGILK